MRIRALELRRAARLPDQGPGYLDRWCVCSSRTSRPGLRLAACPCPAIQERLPGDGRFGSYLLFASYERCEHADCCDSSTDDKCDVETVCKCLLQCGDLGRCNVMRDEHGTCCCS